MASFRSGQSGRRTVAKALGRGRTPRRRWLRAAAVALLLLVVVFPVMLTLLFSVIAPPVTPLMVIRLFEGDGLEKRWRSLERISPHAAQAVIAAEDNLFCRHAGFDLSAIRQVLDEYGTSKRLRGASTISMQVAKNVFLWPARSPVRKALEAYLTLLIEALWSKHRIMEVYLNVAEWGRGIYGIEAAAQHHFGKSAISLTRGDASLLAVILPNPRQWSPQSTFVQRRARIIRGRMGQIEPLFDCL
nr:monofunctional biosynthetic peptidoglycan transglycosylase [Gammaproteobacteria bacterium]